VRAALRRFDDAAFPDWFLVVLLVVAIPCAIALGAVAWVLDRGGALA